MSARRVQGTRVSMIVEQLWQPVPGGSGRYIVELIDKLPATGTKVLGVAARRSATDPKPESLGIKAPVVNSRLPRRALYASWDQFQRPCIDRLIGGTDVVHAPTWTIPPTLHPLVVTVHDLAFLREPTHFTRHGASYFRRALELTRRRADRVIVPSSSTAQDCVSAGIGEDRIRIIAHGVETRDVLPGQVADFARRHGLERPYVLWVGTREPRKNLPILLEAYSQLAGATDLDLVLVGPHGWGDAGIEKTTVSSLQSGRVHLLGRVDDDDLAAAYAGARAFCFPSTWEGFGLPVLEAMAHGVPVVTSKGTSMAEVTGDDAGLLVDPGDPGDLAEALLTAAGPDHDRLGTAGRSRAATFTWERSASEHASVYRELA